VAAEWPVLDALALEQDDVPLADLIYRWARFGRLTGSDDDCRARRKLFDLRLKIAGQIAILRQDAILQRLALALLPRVCGEQDASWICSTRCSPSHGQIVYDASGTVAGEQRRLVTNLMSGPQPEAASAASSVSVASLAAMPSAELMP
jgi:hypothetical protein